MGDVFLSLSPVFPLSGQDQILSTLHPIKREAISPSTTHMALSSLLLLPLAGVAAAQVDIGHLFPDCASGPLSDNDVCNSELSPGERARALVAALRTEEKFGLINNESPGVERLGLPSYEWWRMLTSFNPLSFFSANADIRAK